MRNPTERWVSYIEAAAPQGHVHENNILYKFVETVVWKELHQEGFAVWFLDSWLGASPCGGD
jgi:hypothetical protein